MFRVTVRYGVDSEVFTSDQPITVGGIIGSSDLRARLGYGDNVVALLHGVAMPREAVIPNDETVVLETACNSKARNE